MAGILYFRPGMLAKPSFADVEAMGLGHAFTHQPATRECTGAGPSGTPGVVFADAKRMGESRIGFYPNDQTWKPVPALEGKPQLYIGWYNAARPTPADLARPDQLDGIATKLGDDRSWTVPLVQEWTDNDAIACRLQRPVTRAADGNWVYGDVLPKWQAIWNAAQRLWTILLAATQASVGNPAISYEFDGLHDFACELLSINYAVSWREVSALELFLPETAARICERAVDFRQFLDWLEKKSAEDIDSPNSLAGAEEPIEIIDQH